MSDLKSASVAALEAELARRKEQDKAGPRPKVLPKPDFSRVIEMFEDHLDNAVAGNVHDDDDFDHYVYETVAQVIYGPNFFKWWNKVRT